LGKERLTMNALREVLLSGIKWLIWPYENWNDTKSRRNEKGAIEALQILKVVLLLIILIWSFRAMDKMQSTSEAMLRELKAGVSVEDVFRMRSNQLGEMDNLIRLLAPHLSDRQIVELCFGLSMLICLFIAVVLVALLVRSILRGRRNLQLIQLYELLHEGQQCNEPELLRLWRERKMRK